MAGREKGMTTNGYRVSFLSDENVLKLYNCKQTKNYSFFKILDG